MKNRTPRQIALKCARIANRMKGEDITVLNVKRIFELADYFVITSATSKLHARAIAREIETELDKMGLAPLGVEGFDSAFWILLDYTDVVVHIFLKEMREFYDLELLWGDARSVKWC